MSREAKALLFASFAIVFIGIPVVAAHNMTPDTVHIAIGGLVGLMIVATGCFLTLLWNRRSSRALSSRHTNYHKGTSMKRIASFTFYIVAVAFVLTVIAMILLPHGPATVNDIKVEVFDIVMPSCGQPICRFPNEPEAMNQSELPK